ncbi:MAG: hypothetical protein AAFO07_14785 [Bacteroidota bacterium]
MLIRRFVAVSFFLVIGIGSLLAQSSNDQKELLNRTQLEKLKKIKVFDEAQESVNWTLFIDESERSFYVDFDHFDFNLKEVCVKNAKGEVVFKESVYQLPVDSIYEFDLSAYHKGLYTLEVRSFIGSHSKAVYVE